MADEDDRGTGVAGGGDQLLDAAHKAVKIVQRRSDNSGLGVDDEQNHNITSDGTGEDVVRISAVVGQFVDLDKAIALIEAGHI